MMKIVISSILIASLLTACGGFSSFRLDVQQGNVIEDSKVAQLRPGMTPEQVRFLLGSPIVRPAFVSGDRTQEERMDYVYFRTGGAGPGDYRRLSLFFANGRMVRIEDTAQAVP